MAGKTDNDPVALGALYFIVLLLILLFSIPAGVLAACDDRQYIFAYCQAATVLIGVFMAVLLWKGDLDLWVIMSVGFAVGVAHSIAPPPSAALVADSVPTKDLPSASRFKLWR